MRGLAPIVLLAALAAVFVGGGGNASTPPEALVAPSEVLVLMRAAGEVPGVSGSAGEPGGEGEILDRARRVGVRVRELRPLVPAGATRRAGDGKDVLSARAWVLRYEGSEAPSKVAARLIEDASVEYAGPNHLIPIEAAGPPARALARAAAPPAHATDAPDDPLYDEQIALAALNVPQAWLRTRGAGILIAIIDTGVELDHPDLVERIAVNAAERDGLPGVDDDGNGYADDVWGYDFTDAPGLPGIGDYLGRDADPTDDFGHGTQVAGAAAATRNNGIGIAGVAPESSILALRAGLRTSLPFLPALLQEDDAAAAILYAADRGANILNLSWGDVVEAPIVGEAIRYARARGCLVVAGAGNTPADTSFYPAAYPGVVSVGATDGSGMRAGFSTFGQDLDVVAPGTGVYVTTLGGGYGTAGGTSFSAPLTAGTAALVWSVFPSWTADQVAWRLRMSAGSAREGWNGDLGWGLVDAARAVAEGPLPPVAQIESVRLAGAPGASDGADGGTGGVRVFTGTVASAGLWDWTLSVVPWAGATWGSSAFAAELPGERVLARGVRSQAVAESLGAFMPEPGDSGQWIARLRARPSGFPPIEERTRFTVTPSVLDVADAHVEAQAAGDHWEIVAWWRSRTPYRGSASTTLSGVAEAEETSVSTSHVVRMHGPVPAGAVTVRLGGRAEGESAVRGLGELTVAVPARSTGGVLEPYPDAPAGTPMPRAVNWRGIGDRDLFMESPPVGETYGVVKWLTLQVRGMAPLERASSAGLFTGIPVDAADADGDGSGELVVFRLDGWSVWEADAWNEFPIRRVHMQPADSSVPVRFVSTNGGVRLLVVSGSGVRIYRAGETGYELAGEADGSGGALKLPGEVADIDGDGAPEAVFADEWGDLVVFRIGASSVETLAIQAMEHPQSGKFLKITGTAPAEVLAVSLEASGSGADLEFARAAVRVSRLAWQGGGFEELSHVVVAGLSAERDVQLLGVEPWSAFLRRGRHLDALFVRDSLEWAGESDISSLARVDGAVCYGASGFNVIWMGGAADARGEERVTTGFLTAPRTGLRPPRVESASRIPEGQRLVFAWEGEGCDALTMTMTRAGAPPRSVSVEGLHAVDTLALGVTATYEVRSTDCVWPSLTVTALEPSSPPALAWDGPARILASFARPLGGAPHDVRLRGDAGDILPSVVQLDRSGTRLVVSLAEGVVPDSLFLTGAVDTAGLPVGGTWDLAMALPDSPVDSTVTLAEVRYLRDGSGARIVASVRGPLAMRGPFVTSCSRPFHLEPKGHEWVRMSVPDSGEVTFFLVRPLPAGTYTLSLDLDCLPAGVSPLGLSRSFRVGALVFPNPLRLGEPLILENVSPGSEVKILDVAGRVRASWRATGDHDQRTLGDLAPGLYFIRLQEIIGGSATTRKLVVLR